MESQYRLSLLDRLVPSEEIGFPKALRTARLEILKVLIIRDLNVLLNSRQSKRGLDGQYPLAEASVVYYGLPDFAGFTLNQEQAQDELARTIAQAVRDFEPRLTNVGVCPVVDAGKLSFRLTAEVQMEQVNEHWQLRAVLEGAYGQFVMNEI